MSLSRLPKNAQRATSNAQRPTFELSNSRTSELFPRSGFTMIELVAALALFVIIFGILLIALNTATNLWHNSRAQRSEQTAAEQIGDLIADDLYQAVADLSAQDSLYKSFYLYSPDPTNINPVTVTFYLAFLRPASPRTLIPLSGWSTSGDRLSLDAVYYTGYSNALFRTVLPLFQDLVAGTTNGIPTRAEDLLPSAPPILNDPTLFAALLSPLTTPIVVSTTLLAERVYPTFLASYRDDPDQKPDDIQSDLLPDMLDLSLHIFDTSDWAAYHSLFNDSPDAAGLKRAHLGTLVSRRITLPQAGGSRLP